MLGGLGLSAVGLVCFGLLFTFVLLFWIWGVVGLLFGYGLLVGWNLYLLFGFVFVWLVYLLFDCFTLTLFLF